VFAHNESGHIEAALRAIARAAGGEGVEVFVLANGCTDTTAQEILTSGALVPNLWLFEIDLPDKADAWNRFIHDGFSDERVRKIETFFFTDGDCALESEALALLAATLDHMPGIQAAGGMPANGRDCDAWRGRMVANGTLAGGLYALRSSFVQQLRHQGLRMPVGLIGEDFLVSWLVTNGVGPHTDWPPGAARCAFHPQALFAFRSLSPYRLRDYRTYLRRKWRYTLRGLQFQMLIGLLIRDGLGAMPKDVDELYAYAPVPSRLQWAGLDTPMRLMAMLRIRFARRRAMVTGQ